MGIGILCPLSIYMNIKEATNIIGGLSTPYKMPGFAYGIPAQACITGAKLHQVPNTVCKSCYAFNKGNYAWKVVKNAQNKRLNSLDHPQWVEAFVFVLNNNYKKYIHNVK